MATYKKVSGSIGRKILFWFLVITIIPSVAATVIDHWYSKKLMEEQFLGLLDKTADMVSKEVRDFIASKEAKVVDFSADGLIREGLVVITSGEPGNKKVVEKLNYHLSINKVPLDPDIIEAFVIDLHGRIIVSSNEALLGKDVSDKDYFTEGWRHGIYISDLHHPPAATPSEPIMTMSRIITNIRTGESLGWMVITIRGNPLSNVTRSWDKTKDKSIPRFRGMGRTGEVYIVNEDLLMVTESRFVENAVFKQVVDTEPARMAFSMGEELSGVHTGYRGVKVLGAARLIDEMRWVVLAEKDLTEVMEPIKGLEGMHVGLSIMGVVAVVIIGILITRSLTKDISKLVTATKKVAEGDLDYRISTTSRDEFGYLSNSFNEMTHNLKKSGEEIRALFDDGVDAMFVLSDGERITEVNKSACALLGRERNTLVGANISGFIGNHETMGAKKRVTEAIENTWTLEAGKIHPTLDVSLTSKEGDDVLCELDIKRIEHGVYAVFRDITERKRLELAIGEEKERLDIIVSEIGAGLSLVDRDLKIVWINKIQSSWFGSLKDIQGMRCFNAYWNAKEGCQDCPTQKTFITGTVEKILHSHINSDGKQKWYSITSSPLKDRKGRVTHVLELFEDVTKEKLAEEEFKKMHESVVQANVKLEQSIKELKSTQQQLIQAEKMASVGQLAASVAHEINNPLSYVDNNLGMLTKYSERMEEFLEKCENGKPILEGGNITHVKAFFEEVENLKKEIKLDFILDEFGEIIKESRSGVEQIKKIVSSLSTFSHVGEDLPINADLNKIIEGVLAMLWVELKYKAEVFKEYGDISEIRCYPQQLGQVFMNLLTNAAHAMEDKGKITIKTYQTENNICVEIKDTGKGIPEDVQSKIFEPFFSTKEPGKGTGLGLTVAYNIIQKHFGKIEVSSKVGKGTTFSVTLPIKE
ncbi:MAG: ATP-binding protein [Candidatus Brocadiales bacterium]